MLVFDYLKSRRNFLFNLVSYRKISIEEKDFPFFSSKITRNQREVS